MIHTERVPVVRAVDLTDRDLTGDGDRCQSRPLGAVKVVIGVRQTCPVEVAKNSAEAKLWEKRWWGYDVIAGPVFSDLKTRKVTSVFVNAACRSNWIRVTGYGHCEWGGVHYQSAEVFNTKFVDC